MKVQLMFPAFTRLFRMASTKSWDSSDLKADVPFDVEKRAWLASFSLVFVLDLRCKANVDCAHKA